MKGKHAGETERMVLAAQVETANTNIEACASTLSDMRTQAEAELARVEDQAQAVSDALQSVVTENLNLGQRMAELERQAAIAEQDPTCREQMEVELCPSVPLL